MTYNCDQAGQNGGIPVENDRAVTNPVFAGIIKS